MRTMKNLRNQIVFIVAVLVVWQVVYQMGSFPELMFPSLGKIFQSLIKGFSRDGLGAMTLYSLSLIAKGLLIGIVLAFILSGLSIVSKTFYSIYHMVVSLCDLIPGVALLPLAILWMGIGEGTIILIVVHSIIWPMSRSIMDGFRAVPQIYIESGENMGLGKLGLVTGIYIPASFSYILSGIRTGWARAWRGLISAEMIFGTTSSGARYRMVYFHEAYQCGYRRCFCSTSGDHCNRNCSRIRSFPHHRKNDT